MKIQELYNEILIEYHNGVCNEKGISKKKTIMLGYAVDMLDTICRGEIECYNYDLAC